MDGKSNEEIEDGDGAKNGNSVTDESSYYDSEVTEAYDPLLEDKQQIVTLIVK